jgi:hypothetical protein
MQNRRTVSHSAPFVAVAILALSLAAQGGCGSPVGSALDGGGDGGVNGCPRHEPATLSGCDTPMLTCSYEAAGCAHEMRCVSGQWSFESKACNAPSCPKQAPSDGQACSDLGLACLYGTPVPVEAPCVNTGWGEAICDTSSGTWWIG